MKRLCVLFLAICTVAAFAQFTPDIWELTDGEDKGIGAGFDIVDDLRQPPWLFKYTYDQGRTVTVGGRKFLVPDFVAGSSMHKAITRNQTFLTNSWSDYYQHTFKSTTIAAAASYSGATLNLAFSGTKGYINHILKNGTRSFGYNGATYLNFQLQFKGLRRPELDDDFAYDLTQLPRTYNANTYQRFIKAWGTHYFTRVVYGCTFNVTISFDRSITDKRSWEWATKNLDLSIKYHEYELGYKTEKVVNKTSIDGNFLDASQVDANALGGDEMLFTDVGDYTAWMDSCTLIKAPLPTYSDVEPITELIDDPVIKQNVRMAIVNYGTKGRA